MLLAAPIPLSFTFRLCHVVRKMEDVAAAVDKQQKRSGALQGFWKLLSVSLAASTVGLKVSVEATIDTVNDVALKILDAFLQ